MTQLHQHPADREGSPHAGTGDHVDHGGHVRMFRRLFWVMVVLAVPTVLASQMFASLLGYSLPDVPGLGAVSPALGTVMYVWGGRPFLSGAVDELRARQPGMMLLIGLAITVAFVASWAASLGLISTVLEFWWELALLIVIMLLGHWLEMRSLAQTASALDLLAALLPDEAEKVVGDRVVTVSPDELAVGDLVMVRPGGRVPADGEVVDGVAEVDESMITGESRPVARAVGTRIALPAASPPTTRSGCGWPRSASTPRLPGSGAWSPMRSPPRRGRNCWLTGPRACCSGSRSVPQLSPRSCGRWPGTRRARSSASSPCW